MARVANTAEQYRDSLLALLPKGDAWPTEADSELAKLMLGVAEELARIDARASDLLNESHPSQAFETFEEWEQMYALPDRCSGTDQSFQERKAALVLKYQQFGGQSREFFIAMADALGYAITITEYSDCICGDEVGSYIGGEDWNFIWQINSSELNERWMEAGDLVGDPLRSWGNQQLECMMNKLKHAHRALIFSYT